MEKCLFCQAYKEGARVIHETDHWFVIEDKFPVTQGHLLIIPKRHHQELVSLGDDEWEDFYKNAFWWSWVRLTVIGAYSYNLGVNCGQAAGQTVFHLHIHIIPAYGDDPAPRGGIRNFRPPLVEYP